MKQLKITQSNSESNVEVNDDLYSIEIVEDGIYLLKSDNGFNENTTAIVGYLSDDFTLSPCAKYIDNCTIQFKTGQVALWQSLGIILYLFINESPTYTNDQLATILHAQSLLVKANLPELASKIGAPIPQPK